jgi:nitrous oxide reductase accessory protein NosL
VRSALTVTLALVACTQSADGPAKVMWDRDACKACSMVISDRHFAAQVKPPTGPTQKFDDVGCALKWLDRQPFANDPSVKVWVARHSDGAWIDARAARYVAGKTSPMGFNVGATDSPTDGHDFDTQRAQVRSLAQKR